MVPEDPSRMLAMVSRHASAPGRMLDVGAFNYSGCYRPAMEEAGWTYTGADITPGPNVDVVMAEENRLPFDDASFDAIISGGTMEHVSRPWLWLPELTRVVKPGGVVALITHWMWHYHPHPVDCFRFMPDGMRVLFGDAGLSEPEVEMVQDGHILACGVRR
jgi:SAM-dependent methyltransferase